MPKRKSVLHLQTTMKSKKVREEWNNMTWVKKRACIKQMLKRKADARAEERHPKRTIYHLPLQDEANNGVSRSSSCDDSQDSEDFPTPFLPPSSHTGHASSPLHREDEFERPTSS